MSRNKVLVKYLNAKGISISYERVMAIRSSMAQMISQEYRENGFVFPSQLHKNHFTTSAIDNFDYNLTSTTANTSIHWTGISIFQHPEERLDTAPFRFDIHSKITENWNLFVLPFPSSMLSLGQTQLHNLLEGGRRQPGEPVWKVWQNRRKGTPIFGAKGIFLDCASPVRGRV